MILDTPTANAVMDSLVDGSTVFVYNSTGSRRLAIGVVTHVYKNGFKVEGNIEPIIGTRSKVYLWKDSPVVCPA